MFPGRYKADTAPIPELRPDSSGLVNDLFYRQDTRGHDYLEKSDLESALAKGATGESATTDIVFSSLDGDGDGRITKNELASALKKLVQELVEQFNAGRMARATGGNPRHLPRSRTTRASRLTNSRPSSKTLRPAATPNGWIS
jgi:hypothetical protein